MQNMITYLMQRRWRRRRIGRPGCEPRRVAAATAEERLPSRCDFRSPLYAEVTIQYLPTARPREGPVSAQMATNAHVLSLQQGEGRRFVEGRRPEHPGAFPAAHRDSHHQSFLLGLPGRLVGDGGASDRRVLAVSLPCKRGRIGCSPAIGCLRVLADRASAVRPRRHHPRICHAPHHPRMLRAPQMSPTSSRQSATRPSRVSSGPSCASSWSLWPSASSSLITSRLTTSHTSGPSRSHASSVSVRWVVPRCAAAQLCPCIVANPAPLHPPFPGHTHPLLLTPTLSCSHPPSPAHTHLFALSSSPQLRSSSRRCTSASRPCSS